MVRPVLVTLATAWGPKFGGINSFNTEITKSLGILPARDYDLYCVVSQDLPRELMEECRLRFGVTLVFARNATEIVAALDAAAQPERFLWIGHDDKTGPLALELASFAAGSRAVLIHHMAHGAYQSVKKGRSGDAAEKREAQFGIFRKADLCFAVGPMLRSHLDDLLASLKVRPHVEMLVPGLADPTEYDVELRDSPPENYVAFVAGRLDPEDERIKQGRLALRGFANAVRRADGDSAIRHSPTLRMRGVRSSEEESLRDLLTAEAGGAVNFDLQDYTEDRTAYFRDLASASVAMMPSWHEGFGLTAWEAIGSAVPVVVSEESGVYRLLNETHVGLGIRHSVAPVRIAGGLRPNHTEADVVRVADALLDFSNRSALAKQQAIGLRRDLLHLGRDWKGCAHKLVETIEKKLGTPLTAERTVAKTPAPPIAPTPVDTLVPESLHVPAPRAWYPALGLPTSMLLAARDEVVRFDPERQPILDRIVEWTSLATPLSARLLFGPGGMGKTRLALELARRLQRSGWLSLWLSATPPAGWAEAWAHVLLARGNKPALLVVDYADARPGVVPEAVHKALEVMRANGPAGLVRILLIARSESWLATLAQHESCSQDVAAWLSGSAIESVELPPWSRNEATRLTSYRFALDDYATAIGVTAPPNAYVPRVSDRVFDRPLYLHLAALAALEGQRPVSADALLRDQLRREWHYWRDQNGLGYDDWADALAYVILRQGTTIAELQRALTALGVKNPRLAPTLQRSYPGGVERIAPLEPDLIAEALLRERLAGRRGTAILHLTLGDARAIPIVARVAAHPVALERAEWRDVLIAGIAHHWPGHSDEWVAAAHQAEHGLGDMLVSAWDQLDDAQRTRIATSIALPEYSSNLLRLTTAVRREQLRIASPEPPARAAALNVLSVALSNEGGAASNEALLFARESLELYRELNLEQNERRLADLAMAFANLGSRLHDQGTAAALTEAVSCARQSVRIFEILAARDGGIYLIPLAKVLNNLSTFLGNRDDQSSEEESIACARRAVEICRNLARGKSAYLPELAGSLNNLANALADHSGEALEAAREASGIYRDLAEMQPSTYRVDLAMALTTLSKTLAAQGQLPSLLEALKGLREAVEIYRELARTHPSAYEPYLAIVLMNISIELSEQGDPGARAEALAYALESVEIQQRLTRDNPAHAPGLAMSLNNLAIRLYWQHDTDARTKAVACAREAVRIQRELAKMRPDAYRADLASSLDTLAITLPDEAASEAIDCARESVDLHQSLVTTRPEYRGPLAASLQTLGVRLLQTVDSSFDARVGCLREALEIYTRLEREQPTRHIRKVAAALSNLAGALLTPPGREEGYADALSYVRESVRLYARLYQELPAAVGHDLQISLRTLVRAAAANGIDPESELTRAFED